MISKKNENNLRRKTGRAISDFQLIQENDRILLALSGGKDSLTLLEILLYLKKHAPVSFQLTACTIDEGFPGFDTERIHAYCASQKVPFILKKENIFQIIQEKQIKGPHFCGFCARLRRGCLYTIACQEGFNKIALAHHADDFIETFLLDLLYAGSCWKMPVRLVSQDQRNIVIRPLVYVYEKEIESFCTQNHIIPVPHPCPYSQSGLSKRLKVKRWLNNLSQTDPSIKGNLLHAILKEQI